MQWIFLLSAGVFEIFWAVTLKLTDGFTNYRYLAVNIGLGLGAAFCLSRAMRAIPLSTAYPIWKGIAILGIVAWDVYVDRQPFSWGRTLFALLILTGIAGLKLCDASPASVP